VNKDSKRQEGEIAMRNKKAAAILFSLLLMLGTSQTAIWPKKAYGEQLPPLTVLLLYDSMAHGTEKAGNIELLQRQLSSFGTEVTVLAEDYYSQGLLEQYDRVIMVKNAPEINQLNQSLSQDMATFRGRLMQIGGGLSGPLLEELPVTIQASSKKLNVQIGIGELWQEAASVQQATFVHVKDAAASTLKKFGSLRPSDSDDEAMPFAVMNETAAYVPLYMKGNLSELAMLYVLKDWFGDDGGGGMYLLIKEIYPFSDLKLLAEMADRLYNAGIPFIASVRPVFDNLDYPAMIRYLETIKYIQSRNGSIVVNAPVVASTIGQREHTLNLKMDSFINALGDYGIAPLGMGAEMYWSYDTEYTADGMSFFDSVILFPNQLIMHRSQSNVSQPFASALYSVQPDEIDDYTRSLKNWRTFPVDIALTLDFPQNEEQLLAMVDNVLDRWLVFSDYKLERHEVKSTKHIMTSGNGLLLNGKQLNFNDAVLMVDSEFQYVDKGVISFSKLFSIQNKIFIVIIIFALLFFGILFMAGYRLYKRKYLK
jgi:uncharacterized protein YdaL